MFDINESYNMAYKHFFDGKESVKNPTLSFVFSAPGSGKSSSIKPLYEAEYGKNLVELEIDELKYFLPKDINPKEKNKIIDVWFNKLVNQAIEDKKSIMIVRQRNLLLANQSLGFLGKAKDNGFNTRVTFLAIDKKRSRLGMIHRYETALKNSIESDNIQNYPRKPALISHFIFFRAVPFVAKICEKSKLVDRVDVFDREKNILSWLDKTNGTKSEISPSMTILKQRLRSWEKWEKDKYNNKKENTLSLMKERKASKLDVLKTKLFTWTYKSR